MKRKVSNGLLALLFCFSILGCAQRVSAPVVVDRFCPRPERPTLSAPRNQTEALDAWLTTVKYAVDLEATVGCYEGGKK